MRNISHLGLETSVLRTRVLTYEQLFRDTPLETFYSGKALDEGKPLSEEKYGTLRKQVGWLLSRGYVLGFRESIQRIMNVSYACMDKTLLGYSPGIRHLFPIIFMPVHLMFPFRTSRFGVRV